MRDLSFIRKNGALLLLLSVIVILIYTRLTMSTAQKCLTTAVTPHGILSLELAWDDSCAGKILTAWNKPCDIKPVVCHANMGARSHPTLLQMAAGQILFDYGYIVLYVIFLCILIVVLDPRSSGLRFRSWLLLWAALLAGVMDLVENQLMILYLRRLPVIHAWMFSLPAAVKVGLFIVIAGCLIWFNLQRISTTAIRLWQYLLINRIPVAMLILLKVALGMDQGQDLLLNLNGADPGIICFCIVITVLAVLNWYFPKYYLDANLKIVSPVPLAPRPRKMKDYWNINWNYRDSAKYTTASHQHSNQRKYPSAARQNDQRNTARFLGVLTFLIPMTSILDALSVFRVIPDLPANLVLVLSGSFFWLAIRKEWLDKYIQRAGAKGVNLMVGICVVLLLCILLFAFINNNSPESLQWFVITLLFLAIIFLITVTVRTSPHLAGFLKKLSANKWVLAAAFALSLVFLLANIFPFMLLGSQGLRFLTMPVVLSATIFYISFLTLLIVVGRVTGVNISFFIFAMATAAGILINNSFHDLHTARRINMPDSLNQYLDGWLTAREQQMSVTADSNYQYPVFVVNAYGGGIRAAAWTSFVINMLDSTVDASTQHRETFTDHVFCYSGVSGGTIGASVMNAQRAAHPGDHWLPSATLENLYERDYLTPVLIGMLGRDIAFSFFGISWFDDRARLQEISWAKNIDSLADSSYYREFNATWYSNGARRYDLPLLFANTTQIQDGVKGIMAPVLLDPRDFPAADLLNNMLLNRDTMRSIPYSTGSFISARFPYISPAGRLDANHHYLDGGLKENSGSETAMQVARVFYRGLEDSCSSGIQKKRKEIFSIYFITLNNLLPHEVTDSAKNVFELTAPFTALLKGWEGNTKQADSALVLNYTSHHLYFRPNVKCISIGKSDSIMPVLPLGWQISNYALDRLRKSLSGASNKNVQKADTILSLIQGKREVAIPPVKMNGGLKEE